MQKRKQTKAEEYGGKLNALSKIMKPVPLALALGCSTRSVANWIEDPGLMRLGMSDKIDEVYNRIVVK